MAKGYYKKVDGGYLCPACGTIYSGAFARTDAINCCHDSKPLSELALRESENILFNSYHVPTPRTKQPGDGELYKDRWGHWRRGKKRNKPQLRAEYSKAIENIIESMEAEQLAALDALFTSTDDEIQEWLTQYNKERSIDQKIAYAWNIHNYSLLKSYIQDAINEAVRARELYIIQHPSEYGLEERRT